MEKDIFAELEELQKQASEIDPKNLVNDLDPDEAPAPDDEQPEDAKEESQEGAEDGEGSEGEETPAEEDKPATEEKKADPVEDERPDAAAFARMRRELAAERKKNAEKPPKEAGEPTAEAAQEELASVLGEVIQTVREQKMAQEFAMQESSFAAAIPDYQDVSIQYKAGLYNALRHDNPRDSHAVLLEKTKNALLQKANFYKNQGLDPHLEMYEDAKALGYKKIEPKVEPKAEDKPAPKPDLNKIAANKARSAGTAGARGSGGGGPITRAAAADLTVEEFMKLPRSERQRLTGGE